MSNENNAPDSAPKSENTPRGEYTGGKKKSLDEIAMTMIAPADTDVPSERSVRRTEDSAPRKGQSDSSADDDTDAGSGEIEDDDYEADRNTSVTQDDEDISADSGTDEDEDADEDDDPLAGIFEDESAGDGSRDDEDADKVGQPDLSELGDDATLSVTVDGKEEQVTLGELKRRYAGNGAIEKRLQEVTELRNAVQEDYDNGRQIVEAVFQEFGQALFRRTVPQPNPELMDQNPSAYLRQKTLYDEETQALTQSHMKLHNMMQEVDKINQQQKAQRRKEAAKRLREVMPVFNDPVKGPKVREAILETAREIGFTDEDIAAAEHPLIFKAMALAARELRRQKMAKVSKKTAEVKSAPPKGRKKTPSTQQTRQQKEAKARAAKTGSVDDVAATMIVPQKKRGRR